MSQRCSVNAYSDEIYHSIIDSILPTRDWKRSLHLALSHGQSVSKCVRYLETHYIMSLRHASDCYSLCGSLEVLQYES